MHLQFLLAFVMLSFCVCRQQIKLWKMTKEKQCLMLGKKNTIGR